MCVHSFCGGNTNTNTMCLPFDEKKGKSHRQHTQKEEGGEQLVRETKTHGALRVRASYATACGRELYQRKA